MDLAAPQPGWAALLRDHARRHAPAALVPRGLPQRVEDGLLWADHLFTKENRP